MNKPKQNRRELIRDIPRVALAGGMSLVTLSLVVKSGATSNLPECINHAICDRCSILRSCELSEAVAERGDDVKVNTDLNGEVNHG